MAYNKKINENTDFSKLLMDAAIEHMQVQANVYGELDITEDNNYTYHVHDYNGLPGDEEHIEVQKAAKARNVKMIKPKDQSKMQSPGVHMTFKGKKADVMHLVRNHIGEETSVDEGPFKGIGKMLMKRKLAKTSRDADKALKHAKDKSYLFSPSATKKIDDLDRMKKRADAAQYRLNRPKTSFPHNKR